MIANKLAGTPVDAHVGNYMLIPAREVMFVTQNCDRSCTRFRVEFLCFLQVFPSFASWSVNHLHSEFRGGPLRCPPAHPAAGALWKFSTSGIFPLWICVPCSKMRRNSGPASFPGTTRVRRK